MSLFTPHISPVLNSPISLVQAPTGTGKSTYFPLEIIKKRSDTIILVQPRRAAARMLAHRMAQLLKEPVGQTIGYQIRLEKKFSSQTRVLVVTEGILLRRLQSDPFLDDFNIVMLDEFHERSAQLDLLLLLLQDVQAANENLRLMLCSATLDTQGLKSFFPEAYIANIETQNHPIEVTYLNQPSREKPERLAAQKALKIIQCGCQGHILIFLPGIAEIRRCIEHLERQCDLPIFPLHGRLSIAETQAALAPAENPKIVVSTNIAESSVTIPNIHYVIDSGLERVAIETKLQTQLRTQKITLASAQQRAGRAGRTTKGHVVRLWTQPAEHQFKTHQEPEICRIDILPILLSLYQWGTTPERSNWFTAPSIGSINKAKEELSLLGLIRSDRLTELGDAVVQLPLPPRLALFLLKSQSAGCGRAACAFASLITEGDPWPSSSTLQFWEKVCALQNDHPPSKARHLKQVYRQLYRLLPHSNSTKSDDIEATVCHTFMSIFPERVGYRLGLNSVKLGSGQRANIAERPDRETPYFLVTSISQRDDRTPFVHHYHPIEPEWIPTKSIIQHIYNPTLERVEANVEERIGALLINSRECLVEPSQAESLLFKAAQSRPKHFLNITEACQQWLARLRFWARHHPEEPVDIFDDWAPLLELWCKGKSRRREVLNISVLSDLKNRTPWHTQQRLTDQVPEYFSTPSGARIRIQYPEHGPPEVAARIQQLFGLNHTPHILRNPIRITLLAPNQRPQQQTQDMASFWHNTYPELRKELRGRYPKHAWPDKPTASDAENRPSRRRRK